MLNASNSVQVVLDDTILWLQALWMFACNVWRVGYHLRMSASQCCVYHMSNASLMHPALRWGLGRWLTLCSHHKGL